MVSGEMDPPPPPPPLSSPEVAGLSEEWQFDSPQVCVSGDRAAASV